MSFDEFKPVSTVKQFIGLAVVVGALMWGLPKLPVIGAKIWK